MWRVSALDGHQPLLKLQYGDVFRALQWRFCLDLWKVGCGAFQGVLTQGYTVLRKTIPAPVSLCLRRVVRLRKRAIAPFLQIAAL